MQLGQLSLALKQPIKSSVKMPPKAIIQITDAAAECVKRLLAQSEKPALGIRVGVKQGGCSGLTYTFEYCYDASAPGEKIVDKGVTIFIEPNATLFITGTTLDFVDEKVKSGFVFINPNETGKCGCGTSFSVG